MPSIKYDAIFSSFLGNITDYGLASQDISEAYSDMSEYLHKALANMYIFNLFNKVELDDETQVLTYEMKYNYGEEVDQEFIIMILGKGMVQAWITPQVQNTLLTHQMFSGGDQKWFAQRNHLEELRNLKSDIEIEVRGLIRDRGYIRNTYLDK